MGGEPESVDLTFELPASVGAGSVALVGEFNDWSPDASAMTQSDDGFFRITISLTPGHSYRYCYLIDGSRWENDWQADRYLPNLYGGDDSVVDLTGDSLRVTDRGPSSSTTLDSPTRSVPASSNTLARARPLNKQLRSVSSLASP